LSILLFPWGKAEKCLKCLDPALSLLYSWP